MFRSLCKYGLSAFVVLVFLLGVALQAHSYKGDQWRIDSGGGTFRGAAYNSVGSLGMLTKGASTSASHEHHEGYLALYARPVIASDVASIDFGVVNVTGSRLRSVFVSNMGGVGLFLNDLHFSSGGGGPFSLEVVVGDTVVAPGAHVQVRVQFAPAVAEAAYDTLLWATNDPAVPVWRFPVTGTGAGSTGPAIAIGPDTLDFGVVPLDSSAILELTVENIGTENLVVGPMTTGDASFTVSPDSLYILPHNFYSVEVEFEPDEAALFTDTLWVPSNDPAHPDPIEILLFAVIPSVLTIEEPDDGLLQFAASEDGPAPASLEIRLSNDGAETLHWSLIPGGSVWLEADPDSGSLLPGNNTNIDIFADHAGLASGSYEEVIVLINKDRPLADRDTVEVGFEVTPFTVHAAASKATADSGDTGINIEVAASVDVDSGRVYFRKGGKVSYSSLSMSAHDDTALTQTIPASVFDLAGAEWYVRVYSQGTWVEEPDVSVELPSRIPVAFSDARSNALTGGEYSMISVPLETSGATPSSVFGDDFGGNDPKVWRLGRWIEEDDAYREHPEDNLLAPIDAGNGFWLITRDDTTFGVAGTTLFPEDGDTTYAITIPGGGSGSWWSQIGHPFAYTVDWSSCLVRDGSGVVHEMDTQPGAGLLEDAAYTSLYENGSFQYEEAAGLEAWHGYFVNNISGGDLELLIPARESTTGKNVAGQLAAGTSPGEWTLAIEAHGEKFRSGKVFIGTRDGASHGWDRFDRYLPPSPMNAGNSIAVHNNGKMPISDDLRADMRPISPDVLTWDITVDLEGSAELYLAVENEIELPEGITAYFVDDRAGAILPVGLDFEYRIVPYPAEKSRTVKLVAGPTAVLSSDGYKVTTPVTFFNLGLPYPNPARNGTMIRYAIPEEGSAQLRVFGVQGRLVREVFHGVRAAGDHVEIWDGRDRRGREVGTGLYFFRLEYKGQTCTARIVVFK